MPHYDLQGCHALVKGDHITYIGSAFGRGNSVRRGFGISARIASCYVRRDRSVIRPDRLPVFTFLNGYTGAFTIGFRDYAYLAIALEHFLIGCFATDLPDNKIAIFKNARLDSASDSPLMSIERHFHDVIRGRAADLLNEAPDLQLPTIDESVPVSEEAAAWFPIPGMHGGFKFWLDPARDRPTLISESWSRVVEGSGERHEINAEGSILADQGFV